MLRRPGLALGLIVLGHLQTQVRPRQLLHRYGCICTLSKFETSRALGWRFNAISRGGAFEFRWHDASHVRLNNR